MNKLKKAFCYQKLFWPFTVWINCSSDLKIFANSRPSVSNFKSFSRSLEHFFLTVGQNNFCNKIPCISVFGPIVTAYFVCICKWQEEEIRSCSSLQTTFTLRRWWVMTFRTLSPPLFLLNLTFDCKWTIKKLNNYHPIVDEYMKSILTYWMDIQIDREGRSGLKILLFHKVALPDI